MTAEPIFDVAHLGHFELLTPKPDESLAFFVDLLGMEIEARAGQSVYLRGFGDYERYCLKLTEGPEPRLAALSFRTRSAAALQRRAEALATAGVATAWGDGELAHGETLRFRDPEGRSFELYYETERYVPPPGLEPAMPNQPQRRPTRGVGVRRLEHLNFLSPDVRAARTFMQDLLGYKVVEIIELDDGTELGAWLTVSAQGHEVIYLKERLATQGRLHHAAFWVDTREEVLRAADLFQDAGIVIETGPAKHTPIQAFYVYVREPGGSRIEVTSGGMLTFDPDPVPFVWSESAYRSARAWGASFPASFDTYAMPPLDH